MGQGPNADINIHQFLQLWLEVENEMNLTH